MFQKLRIYYETLRYLKFIQIYYRLYYALRLKIGFSSPKKKAPKKGNSLHFMPFLYNATSYQAGEFTFINIAHRFEEKIDWNLNSYGKLWTYNLNYFEFLFQKGITKEQGVLLMKDYISQDAKLLDGKEPYTISLRVVNWIKFISQHQIREERISQQLYQHCLLLEFNLEYHLLGNHLLENGFAFLFAAYYFQDQDFYKLAKKILKKEVEEQTLSDGGHFELSPMYHQIILYRILDCISLLHNNKWIEDELLLFLEEKASQMLSWLKKMTYKNGSIPMLNDSTEGIAPTSAELFQYANRLNIAEIELSLSDSGYRKINRKHYELLVDVGHIGPDYQPAHAHSDTFNFELIANGKPIVVDTGISTYEKNAKRQLERSTQSHNTVEVFAQDQSQVWGGFRVARRARIIALKEDVNVIKSTHNGYKHLGIHHERTFVCEDEKVTILDVLSRTTNHQSKAFLHLHPSVSKPIIKEKSILLSDENIKINIDYASSLELLEYEYAKGFNKTTKSFKIIITFDTHIQTSISL